jgi:hypothetical protein
MNGEPAPPAAGSAGGMSIAIRSVRLTAKVVVQVEVSVTCQPKPVSEYPVRSYWDETSVQGYVRQASGKSIAFGSIQTRFSGDAVCDGTPHLFLLDVAAEPAGVPFKAGSAVVAASGYSTWDAENWETGEYSQGTGFASTGWVATRLGK